jgi:hypothetical protein
VTGERFVGARALWRHDTLRELFVTFADPSAVGLSALAGMLAPLARGSGRGLHVRLAQHTALVQVLLQVPLAPGLVTEVPVAGFETLERGVRVALALAPLGRWKVHERVIFSGRESGLFDLVLDRAFECAVGDGER